MHLLMQYIIYLYIIGIHYRPSYPVVQPYPDNSRRNQYPEPPISTTSNPIRLRRPTVVTTQANLNIRGYKDGWVEENGRRRRQKVTTTTRRPTTTRPYRRTRKPRPTTARYASYKTLAGNVYVQRKFKTIKII